MSEEPKAETPKPEAPKVFDLFSRKPVEQKNDLIAFAQEGAPPAEPQHDTHAVATLEGAIEAYKTQGCKGFVGVTTSANGLPRIWISIPKGVNPQIHAVQMLGQLEFVRLTLQNVMINGVDQS